MLIILGILLGIMVGIFMPYNIPSNITPYFAIGLLAALDTVFGGLAAEMEAKFDLRLFISGFFANTVLAMILTFVGNKLGMDLSLAAIVVFGTRMFNNFSRIRQHILQKGSKRVKIKEMGEPPHLWNSDMDDENELR